MLKIESKRIGKADTSRMTPQTISRADEKSSELSTAAVDLEMDKKAMPANLVLTEEPTILSSAAEAGHPVLKGILKTLVAITLI